MQEAIKQLSFSYGRALGNPRLMDRFYELLMKSHPTIPKYFEKTDLAKQKQLLSQSINMAILFPQKNKIAINAISRIKKSHSHANLDIKPHLYTYWLDSLIAALEESDKDFTPELEKKWRETLQVAIDYIKEGYSQ